MKLENMDLIQLGELYILKSDKAEQLEREADEVAQHILDWASKHPFAGINLGDKTIRVDTLSGVLWVEEPMP